MIALFSAPFYFLRHGETDANAADLIAGTSDVPLNATGTKQARSAAGILAGQRLAAIWCSPLQRARQTAAAVAKRSGLTPQVVAGLGERDWGGWEGEPRARLIREATPPGGESPEAFHRRTLAALARITPPFPVLVVAHSGTARVIAAELCPDRDLARLGNAEPVLWRPSLKGWEQQSFMPDGPRCVTHPDTPHSLGRCTPTVTRASTSRDRSRSEAHPKRFPSP